MPPSHIAVLGGGLSGLSSAFHLARRLPNAHITLLERAPRFGGWVRSERVAVSGPAGSASVLVEAGPRTLRPNSKAVLELIHLLGLGPALITTPRTAPAARNRFLYLAPGAGADADARLPSGIVRLPASLPALLTAPLARTLLLPALLREPFRARAGAPVSAAADESLDAFLARRFGAELARVLGSALAHGVYAADARALSVRAAFPTLVEAERRGGGSVVRGVVRGMLGPGAAPAAEENTEKCEMGDVEERMRGVAVFSFMEGLSALTDGLVGALHAQPNVRLVSGAEVTRVDFDPITQTFQLAVLPTALDPATPPITHLVSALPLPALATLLTPSSLPPLSSTSSDQSLPQALTALNAHPASSVHVLNLIFPPTRHPIHPAGFGYLVPRPAGGYPSAAGRSAADADPGVLGVVFDSCALGAQDRGAPGYTKLTAMLGGPYPSSSSPPPSIPAALARLSAQLGTPLPEPVYTRMWTHKRCIPPPAPGHLTRVRALRGAVENAWGGRGEVVGAGVGGVSVGDCVKQGRDVGRGWA